MPTQLAFTSWTWLRQIWKAATTTLAKQCTQRMATMRAWCSAKCLFEKPFHDAQRRCSAAERARGASPVRRNTLLCATFLI